MVVGIINRNLPQERIGSIRDLILAEGEFIVRSIESSNIDTFNKCIFDEVFDLSVSEFDNAMTIAANIELDQNALLQISPNISFDQYTDDLGLVEESYKSIIRIDVASDTSVDVLDGVIQYIVRRFPRNKIAWVKDENGWWSTLAVKENDLSPDIGKPYMFDVPGGRKFFCLQGGYSVSGWRDVAMEDSTVRLYFDPNNDNTLSVGWSKIDGEYYHFYNEIPYCRVDEFVIDGTTYYTDNTGKLIHQDSEEFVISNGEIHKK